MTWTQNAWLRVLTAQKLLYPHSRMAEEDKEERKQTACLWAEEMRLVPPDAIEPLHRRVMNTWTGSVPPTIGEYRKVWLDWDYYKELNENPEAKAPVRALEASLPSFGGLGPTGTRLQIEIFRRTGSMVHCECVSRGKTTVMVPTDVYNAKRAQFLEIDETNGPLLPVPAVLSPDRKDWVCAEGHCPFCVSVESTMPAPRTQTKTEEAPRQAISVNRSSAPSDETTVPQEQNQVSPEAPFTPSPKLRALVGLFGCKWNAFNEEQQDELKTMAVFLEGRPDLKVYAANWEVLLAEFQASQRADIEAIERVGVRAAQVRGAA